MYGAHDMEDQTGPATIHSQRITIIEKIILLYPNVYRCKFYKGQE